MSKSCAKCKFLYGNGAGYSNYTWENTYATCAIGKHPLLIGERDETDTPYDWNEDPENDNWPMTASSRCESYERVEARIVLDVDRECWPRHWEGYRKPESPLVFVDESQFQAIWSNDNFWDKANLSLLTLAIYNGSEPYLEPS